MARTKRLFEIPSSPSRGKFGDGHEIVRKLLAGSGRHLESRLTERVLGVRRIHELSRQSFRMELDVRICAAKMLCMLVDMPLPSIRNEL